MADESHPVPSEQYAPEPLPAALTDQGHEITRAVAGDAVPAAAPLRSILPDAPDEIQFKRPLWRLVLGWFLLLLSFFAAGVVLNLLVHLVFGVDASLLVGIFLFIAFALADQNGELSQVFGVQTRPNSSPVRSVLYFLTFGLVAFMFVRRDPATVQARTSPAAAPQTGDLPQPPAPAPENKDIFREVAETIVFVVVLVLLLKTFIAEAFVIPTGSMATTLWGYQKYVTCPNCEFQFPVNASAEGDPAADTHKRVTRCECPNCRYEIDCSNVPYHSGDRVLVFKALYDTGLHKPQRQDVVVFKYPVEPQVRHTAMNYIKRLVGLPGETIAICGGQLYNYDQPRTVPAPESYWGRSKYDQYPWPDDAEALQLWNAGKFQIVRKYPDQMLAMSRIVFDNDFQPTDTEKYPIRWSGELNKTAWQGDGKNPRTFTGTGKPGPFEWLHYHNVLAGGKKPELISDFMGYNSSDFTGSGSNWVGDLMLECELTVDSANAGGAFVVELCRGPDRFQARFNLADGNCTLYRGENPLPLSEAAGAPQATKPTAVKGPGKYTIRLANFDQRLTLWVNGDLPFGHGVDYKAPDLVGPTEKDLQPASFGVADATVSVSHLKLSRDTFYTARVGGAGGDVALLGEDWARPEQWGAFRTPSPRFLYVQPGHYLCMGDNSPASADSRSWGMVPDRLMLGRALVVYFPFAIPGYSPVNRVGLIK